MTRTVLHYLSRCVTKIKDKLGLILKLPGIATEGGSVIICRNYTQIQPEPFVEPQNMDLIILSHEVE